MKLIQQPGEEKLLISKQKALSTRHFLFWVNILLLGRPGPLKLPASFYLNLPLLRTLS